MGGKDVTWFDVGGGAMTNRQSFSLETHPIHLGLGAVAIREPEFTGADWFAAYEARHAADGAEGRLVSLYTFSAPWTSWEMHPAGAEVIVCVTGQITLLQEADGQVRSVKLAAGEAAINPPGVWHTADVEAACTALFITAGAGTQHRAR